jgi:MFS family permease
MLGFFNCLTYVITSPIAGVLVDRWPRRKVMILADLCAGMMTLGLMLLFVGGKMSLPLVYLAVGLTGIFEAFKSRHHGRPFPPWFTGTIYAHQRFDRLGKSRPDCLPRPGRGSCCKSPNCRE